jgi:hypothetical protein
MRRSYFEFLYHIICFFWPDFSVKPATLFFRVLDLVQTDAEFVAGGGEEIYKKFFLPMFFHHFSSTP